MKRSRFPYTTTMSADVIRHAVSIDERRAKFRQDLVSQAPPKNARHHHLDEYMQWMHLDGLRHKEDETSGEATPQRPKSRRDQLSSQQERFRPRKPEQHQQHQREQHHHRRRNSTDSAIPIRERFDDGYGKPRPRHQYQNHHRQQRQPREGDQDISEVWFAGEHADIGGGWWLLEGETRPASDLPLIWMLREAMRAGMPIDEAKLARAQYHAGEMVDSEEEEEIYRLEDDSESDVKFNASNEKPPPSSRTKAQKNIHPLHHLATQTRLHDSLSFTGGLPFLSVLTWQIMEHLPFRRMDLQSDGTWKPISWPLPRGETRDMPDDARIHGSVIARMRSDPSYRPGNLILGGGGRGVRRAPPQAGIGEWVPVVRARGVGVGGAFVRARRRTTG
jgi:hypothetical protein